MLAYLFWHYPRDDVKPPEYEAGLAAFHGVLQRAGMNGLQLTTSYRVKGLSWINAGGAAYEDWYLVEDWADFGPLNAIAVGGERKDPHDRTAAEMSLGAGGLYALRAENEGALVSEHAAWLAKPKGMTYAEFDDLVEPALTPGAILWRRMMVLGPATEFCLTSPQGIALPPPLQAAVALEREPIVASLRDRLAESGSL